MPDRVRCSLPRCKQAGGGATWPVAITAMERERPAFGPFGSRAPTTVWAWDPGSISRGPTWHRAYRGPPGAVRGLLCARCSAADLYHVPRGPRLVSMTAYVRGRAARGCVWRGPLLRSHERVGPALDGQSFSWIFQCKGVFGSKFYSRYIKKFTN